ncbi:MAG: endolytic transglycosylase MltG [Bacteroidales bacterium]|nr:endolytic transglycosylase MltG [Bacteroidales bacterium]
MKRVLYVLLVVIVLAGIKAYSLYSRAFSANIILKDKHDPYLYIPTGTSYEEVLEILSKSGKIRNIDALKWVAQKKNYPNHVKPGRYKLKNRMSNNELINMLRSGSQEPVMLTFNNIRTPDQLSERIAEQLEFSSDSLLKVLISEAVHKKYNFSQHTFRCMFIPNTYEFYWNTSPENFVERMYNEYNEFWTKKRVRKSEQIGLSKEEVIILASIVDQETIKDDEKEIIAGVYMNRLQKNIRLHADPTVIYAVGDFSIKRVLRKHYNIDSPYNTYKHGGLPPGPICLPEISSIDAVLNYREHSYLYFCAKPDFSGYHNFAKTLEEHNRNAKLYRRELNRRRIYN